MITVHAHAARTKKIALLVDALIEAGMTCWSARCLTDAGWDAIAYAAGCKAPSPATRELVLQQLAAIEAEQREESAWEDKQEYAGNRCPTRE